jgi:predicted ATP-dependent serine protease
VALTGQVRPAPGMAQRLSAARAAGLRTVFAAPTSSSPGPEGVRVVSVRHVRDALGWAVPQAERGRLEEVVTAG